MIDMTDMYGIVNCIAVLVVLGVGRSRLPLRSFF